MTSAKLWRTKGGVLVLVRGRKLEMHRGVKLRVKVAAYRVDTGGFHGWLWLHNLEAHQ